MLTPGKTQSSRDPGKAKLFFILRAWLSLALLAVASDNGFVASEKLTAFGARWAWLQTVNGLSDWFNNRMRSIVD